jgi:hypothetical protein
LFCDQKQTFRKKRAFARLRNFLFWISTHSNYLGFLNFLKSVTMAENNFPHQLTRTSSSNAGNSSRPKVHRSASMPAIKGPVTVAPNSPAAYGKDTSNTSPYYNPNAPSTGNATNIQVAVRCRPMNHEEKKHSQVAAISSDIDTNSVKVSYNTIGKKVNKSVEFDKVFGVYSRQQEVYETVVRPIVDEMLQGYNCTIFAYGPTGTGKTYTMEGDINTEDTRGMIPRTARSLLEALADPQRFDYNLKISYLEIYNEELRDLLNPIIDKNNKVRLQEHVNHNVIVKNLEEFSITTVERCMDLLKRGSLHRQTSATLSNTNSSRSHAIFTFKLAVRETVAVGEEVMRIGQLNLVDLAG